MMNTDILDPPSAHGVALFEAILKQQPEDFRVSEELDISFSGDGEHLYLQIEKTAMNTDEIAAALQSCYAVTSADVGLSGLKDRHSISIQWFSVRTHEDASLFEKIMAEFNDTQKMLWADTGGYIKSMRLLRCERHARKLRRGAHRSNHFRIVLHQIQTQAFKGNDLRSELERRVQLLIEHGFPNYIGPQRFGHNGQNLQRARQWFSRPKKRTSRQQRSLWLSAARSAVFNSVCAARVRAGTWNRLLEGEPAMLDGSNSFFATGKRVDAVGEHTETQLAGSEPMQAQLENAQLEQRLRDADIHPSAPWWGRGRSPAQGECLDVESLALEPLADLCEGMERAGLTLERRAIRAIATDLTVSWRDDECVELSFALMPGVFATTLLREICYWQEPLRGESASA